MLNSRLETTYKSLTATLLSSPAFLQPFFHPNMAYTSVNVGEEHTAESAWTQSDLLKEGRQSSCGKQPD